MTKENKHIDDLFKEGLQGLELPTSASDFDAVMAGLPKKKKRRFFWIWLIPLVLGIASLPFLLSEQDQGLSELPKEERSADSNSPHRPIASDNDVHDSGIDEPISEDETLNETASNETIEENRSPAPERTPQSQETPATSEQENGEFTASSKETDQNNPEVGSNDRPITPVGDEHPSNKAEEKSDDADDNSTELDSTKQNENIENYDSLDAEESIPEVLTPEKDTSLKNTPQNNHKNVKWFVGLQVGAKNPSYITASQSNSVLQRYATLKENEVGLISPALGLELGRISNGWSSSAGIEYYHMRFENDNFTYQIHDSFPFRNQAGDTIDWIRLNYRDTSTLEKMSSSYRSLILPVNLGYNFSLNPKLGCEIRLGLSPSFQIGTSGNTLNTSLELSELSSSLRSFNLGYNSQLSLLYQLKDQLKLEVGASYGGNVTSLYKKESQNLTSLRINSLGIHTKLRYEIGN